MGHYCRVCEKIKSNEKFSGRGHKNNICKACSCLPKKDRNKIVYLQEIYGFWEQKNISKKNIAQLDRLSECDDKEVAAIACVLREVAIRFPLKKKRIARIAKEMPELIAQLESVGLIHSWIANDQWEVVDNEAQVIYEIWDEYCKMMWNKA